MSTLFSALDWRAMSQEDRDLGLNNGVAVPASAEMAADWERRSAVMRQRHPDHIDLRYGPRERNRIDFLKAREKSPTVLFIHGGYWQELSKDDSLFAAPDCLANGIAYAAIDYTLAPRANIAGIVDQCRRAVASLHRQAATLAFDRRRLYVAGSSAGAHLAAMLLVRGWHGTHGVPDDAVAGAVLLSGIYDLAPLVGTYIDAALRLTAADTSALSPIRLPHGRSVPAIVTWGEFETGEFKRQSRAYAEKLQVCGFSVSAFEVAGTNHFDIVFGLANRTNTLGRATLELVTGKHQI